MSIDHNLHDLADVIQHAYREVYDEHPGRSAAQYGPVRADVVWRVMKARGRRINPTVTMAAQEWSVPDSLGGTLC